jgi:hypothetical protein
MVVREPASDPKQTVEEFAKPSTSQAYDLPRLSGFLKDSIRLTLRKCESTEKFLYLI